MEESINLAALIRKSFCVKEVDIRTYSPLTLAFIGDGIYDLIIRTILVSKGNESTNRLQHKTASYVKAGTQSAMIRALMPYLTEEELAIYKRGRNAKPHTTAKNATLEDYHRATGFEALVGYLYLLGRTGRILEILNEGLRQLKMDKI